MNNDHIEAVAEALDPPVWARADDELKGAFRRRATAAISALEKLGAYVGERKTIYRHKKTGGLYERLLPMGRIQSSSPLHDMDEVAIYRSIKDETLWARKASEFDDGRFEPLSTAPKPAQGKE